MECAEAVESRVANSIHNKAKAAIKHRKKYKNFYSKVWEQETVRSSRTTRTNEKRDSEITDFRVPFPCSISTARLDLNPSNSTGLGS